MKQIALHRGIALSALGAIALTGCVANVQGGAAEGGNAFTVSNRQCSRFHGGTNEVWR